MASLPRGPILPGRDDIMLGWRLLRRLPAFLHRRPDESLAAAIIKTRLANRRGDFLRLVRRSIFQYPASPYLALFRQAGLEFGDLVKMVESQGLQESLSLLLKNGVFLRVDEFKGRRPIKRGGAIIKAGPVLLRNPYSEFHLPVHSGGSRTGAGTPTLIDLAYVADCAVNSCLFLEPLGGGNWRMADWEVPGGGALFRLLKYCRFGARPVRWFSQLDPASPELHPRYRHSARLIRLASAALGAPLPRAQYVPLADPMPIVDWMAWELWRGETPMLWTFPSSAVRVAQAALHSGRDLAGARAWISGEPISEARLRVIKAAGIEPLPRYGTIETGPIGYGCRHPQAPDDLHLLGDLHAVIQAGDQGDRIGVPAKAVFISCLRPSAPFVMLNVSLGDRATLQRRDCGCPLQTFGWDQHISGISSFEKLTGGGMNFLDSDVIKVLEEVLPARFGGAPTSYQLVEEEGPGGEPRLRLLAHPALGELDHDSLLETFIKALGEYDDSKKLMSRLWQESAYLKVERRPPLATVSGKILHIHKKMGKAPAKPPELI